MAVMRRRTGAGQNAACTASFSSTSLVGKTRKIVPSATPASWAISLVVGLRPSRWASRTNTSIEGVTPVLGVHRRRPALSRTRGSLNSCRHQSIMNE